MIPPLSTLSREGCALVVIDPQERLATAMDRRDAVLASTCRLLGVAGILGLPVVATRQYPKGLGDLDGVVLSAIEGAQQAGSEVRVVDKVSFDCFAEPAFRDAVAGTGRRQLVLVGMETHICVTQTALAALAEGFDVHVIADACCSRDAANHDLALARLRSAGAVVSTWESAAYELVGAAGTPEFKALLAIVKG